MTLDDFLAARQFFGYRDLLSEVFEGNADALVDAYCTGALTERGALALEDTMDPQWLQVLLLRRVSRQLAWAFRDTPLP